MRLAVMSRQLERPTPINQAPDPDSFRTFEHDGWTSNVSAYDAAFGRVASQAIGPLWMR